MTNPQQASYVVIHDRERSDVMAIIMKNIAYDSKFRARFEAEVESMGLLEAAADLIHEHQAKKHDMGWCDEPNCGWDEIKNSNK